METLYYWSMTWDIEVTDEFIDWLVGLEHQAQDQIEAAIQILEERGPALGRPLVDTIATSRHANMKELRPASGSIRILFAFDPRRTAILLIGGDKRNQWNAWYERTVPIADSLYDDYLKELRQEGILE